MLRFRRLSMRTVIHGKRLNCRLIHRSSADPNCLTRWRSQKAMAETITLTRINLGSATAIPLGQGRCYVVGGQEIAVFRQRDGRLFATENRCPHRRGPLSEGIVG